MSKQVIFVVALCAPLSLGCVAAAASPAPAGAATRQPASSINCSEAYGGAAASCEQISCNATYRPFLGTWSGRFWAYVRRQSTHTKNVYRPYHEVVTYSTADCLRNVKTGDSFILGHQTESYPPFKGLPAKAARNLLISGQRADGTPFLRITMEHHTYEYRLTYKNGAAKLAVWELDMPASKGQPQMTFTTIDGRDFTAQGRTRDVTVTLTVGPLTAPYWQGVIDYGSHSKQAR
ncbi:MAG: hypothetical protein ACREUL_17830 [Steroidobacteraceae bacterium]